MPPWVAPVARSLVFVRMSLSLRSRTSAFTPPSSRYRRGSGVDPEELKLPCNPCIVPCYLLRVRRNHQRQFPGPRLINSERRYNGDPFLTEIGVDLVVRVKARLRVPDAPLLFVSDDNSTKGSPIKGKCALDPFVHKRVHRSRNRASGLGFIKPDEVHCRLPSKN